MHFLHLMDGHDAFAEFYLPVMLLKLSRIIKYVISYYYVVNIIVFIILPMFTNRYGYAYRYL